MRGSGGVGLLGREKVLGRYAVEVLETNVEDVLWVRLGQENEECLMLAICYIPPETSRRGRGMEETFQLLAEQVAKFHAQGHIMCGDFSARRGRMEMNSEGMPSWKVVDVMKNSQGEAFVDFLRGVKMTVVNGRKGRDAFMHLCV